MSDPPGSNKSKLSSAVKIRNDDYELIQHDKFFGLRKEKLSKEVARMEKTIAGEHRTIHDELMNLTIQVEQLTRDNQELNLKNAKLLDENLYYSRQLLESRELLEELQASKPELEVIQAHDTSSNELVLDNSTQYGDSPFKVGSAIEIEHKTPLSKGTLTKSKVNIELYRSMNTPVVEEDAKDRVIAEYLDIIQKQTEMIEQLKNMKVPTMLHTRKGSMAPSGFIDLHESIDSIQEKENYQFGRRYPKSRLESFHTSHQPEMKLPSLSRKKISHFNGSEDNESSANMLPQVQEPRSGHERSEDPQDFLKSSFKKVEDFEHPESPSISKSVKFLEQYQVIPADAVGDADKQEESQLAEMDSQANPQIEDEQQDPNIQDDSFAIDNPIDEVRSSHGDMMAAQRKLLNNSSAGELESVRYTRAATIQGSKVMGIKDFTMSQTDAKKELLQKVRSHKMLRPNFEDKSRIQGLMKRFSKLKKSGALSADFSRDYLGIQERPKLRELLKSIGDNCLKVYSDVVGLYKSQKKKVLTILVATSRQFSDSRGTENPEGWSRLGECPSVGKSIE